MVSLFVRPEKHWRKIYVRFEGELADNNLSIDDCYEGKRIAISVITSNDRERELVTKLARKWFGDSFMD